MLPKAGVVVLPNAEADCPNAGVVLPNKEVGAVPKAGVEEAPKAGAEEAPNAGVAEAPNAGVVEAPKAGVDEAPKAGVVDPNGAEPNAGVLAPKAGTVEPKEGDPNEGCVWPKGVLPKGLGCVEVEPKPPNGVGGFWPKTDVPENIHHQYHNYAYLTLCYTKKQIAQSSFILK